MKQNLLYCISLITLIIVVFTVDKCIQKKNVEQFSNSDYIKIEDTIVAGSMAGEPLKGTLDQAKDNCNSKDNCVGVVRKNVEAQYEGDYYIIEKIDYCVNKNNKLPPKENKNDKKTIQNLIYGNTYSDYSVYLKAENEESNHCIRLNKAISLKHLKHPFERIIVDEELSFRSKSLDDISEDKEKIYAKNGVIQIVKGLSGEGVSFELNINGVVYYLVNKTESDEITVSLLKDNSDFKKNASFHLDLNYVVKKGFKDLDNSKYISIKKTSLGKHYYWKINDINKKIVLVNQEDIKDDNNSINNVLFEIIKPMEYTDVSDMIEVPSPSVSEDNEDFDYEKEGKKDELEDLEIDIRKLQHEQNLKLMDVMVNVNKFKLMDLSLSDYLTKCTKNSSDQNVSVLNNNTTNNTNTNNTNNTNSTSD